MERIVAKQDTGRVAALAASRVHGFSKRLLPALDILAGIGVAGDAHAGKTVRHRSRVAADAAQLNLRQVHLIHRELLDELAAEGFAVTAGDLGENITTAGIDLLALPVDTMLRIGKSVVLEITGLRNPCSQIENFHAGLLGRVARRRSDGTIERLTGIMCVAREGGRIEVGDDIVTVLPPLPHCALGVV